MRITVLDDEPNDLREILHILRELLAKHKPVPQISGFMDYQKCMTHLSATRTDILLLDICMGERNGIDMARVLRACDKDCAIIFVTSSRDYAIEAFEVTATHYLVKPVTHAKMLEALQRTPYFTKERPMLSVTVDYMERRVPLANILYIKSVGRRTLVHLNDGDTLSTYMPLNRVSEQIAQDHRFLPCYRGVIVNMESIRTFEAGGFTLNDGEKVPVAQKKVPEIERIFRDYMVQKMRARFSS